VTYYKQLVHATTPDTFEKVFKASPPKLQEWINKRGRASLFQLHVAPTTTRGRTTSQAAEAKNSAYRATGKKRIRGLGNAPLKMMSTTVEYEEDCFEKVKDDALDPKHDQGGMPPRVLQQIADLQVHIAKF